MSCPLCGGNDSLPPQHTQDCHYAIQRAGRIEEAAEALLLKLPPGLKASAAAVRLRKALGISLVIRSDNED